MEALGRAIGRRCEPPRTRVLVVGGEGDGTEFELVVECRAEGEES